MGNGKSKKRECEDDKPTSSKTGASSSTKQLVVKQKEYKGASSSTKQSVVKQKEHKGIRKILDEVKEKSDCLRGDGSMIIDFCLDVKSHFQKQNVHTKKCEFEDNKSTSSASSSTKQSVVKQKEHKAEKRESEDGKPTSRKTGASSSTIKLVVEQREHKGFEKGKVYFEKETTKTVYSVDSAGARKFLVEFKEKKRCTW